MKYGIFLRKTGEREVGLPDFDNKWEAKKEAEKEEVALGYEKGSVYEVKPLTGKQE